jgi:ABC-type branched-subunit amino acid transport system substrate-binding protein
MFHVRASYADETEAIINQWATLGLKNFAVFYQNDGFGKSGLNGVNAALKKYNLTPSALGTVERNSGDVSKAVAAIAKARPQAVVMVSVYKASAEFIREMRKAGQSPQFAVLSPVGSNLLAKELGDGSRGVGISQVMPSPTNDIVPLVKDYRRLMVQAKKEQAITYFGLEGYLSARLLVEAMKKAGKDLTREKVVDALESMHQLDVGGYRIDYSPTNHNGSKFVDVIVIGKDGRVMK